MKINISLPHALLLLILATGTTTTRAAGFQLIEQNASGLGSSYAGSAAIAENASTIFFNPAGMTQLPGVNFSAGAAAIKPSFKFSDEGGIGPDRRALGTNAGGDAGSVGVLPNMYLSWQLDSRWFAGLGVSAPFGLKTEYDDNWVGRYYSNRFSIESVNVNPSIAYKVNDRLSLGAGINWLYMDADYQRHLGSPLSLAPGDDINARVKISGNAWGWNVGLLYQATPDTRLGLSYRSKVNLTANGSTSFGDVPARLQGKLPSVDANSTVALPDTAIISLAHDLNERWRILADVSWTGWSGLSSFDVDNAKPLPNESMPLGFRNTWRVAMGVNYTVNQRWTLKGGAAWEQSPVNDSALRPPALPDSDRIMMSIGARYNFNRNTSLDVGYAHLFLRDAPINNSSGNNPGTPNNQGTISGIYTANADVVGIQLSHRF